MTLLVGMLQKIIKMKKEFNLSKKERRIEECKKSLFFDVKGIEDTFFHREDVKEFIKRLKEAHMKHTKDDYFLNVINKLAGDDLI